MQRTGHISESALEIEPKHAVQSSVRVSQVIEETITRRR